MYLDVGKVSLNLGISWHAKSLEHAKYAKAITPKMSDSVPPLEVWAGLPGQCAYNSGLN